MGINEILEGVRSRREDRKKRYDYGVKGMKLGEHKTQNSGYKFVDTKWKTKHPENDVIGGNNDKTQAELWKKWGEKNQGENTSFTHVHPSDDVHKRIQEALKNAKKVKSDFYGKYGNSFKRKK